MERASLAAALNQRQDRVLVADARSDLDARLAADERLVNLDDLARTAHRARTAKRSASRMRWQRNHAAL